MVGGIVTAVVGRLLRHNALVAAQLIIQTALLHAQMGQHQFEEANGDMVLTWTATMMVSAASKVAVTSERDLRDAANMLMQKHGNDAWFHASQRADELLRVNDLEGHAMFKAILARIAELEEMAPTSSIQ